MKVQMVVVDLELSRRARRWLVRAGAFVAMMAGAVAIAYAAVPKTWTANQVLTADDLNANFAAVDGKVTAWVPYTFSVSTSGGTAVTIAPVRAAATTGLWRRVGDSLEVSIQVRVPTCPGDDGILLFPLPNNLVPDFTKLPSLNAYIGSGIYANGQTGLVLGVAVLTQDPLPTVGLQILDPSAAREVNCSSIAMNANLRFSFTVPIQGWSS
jgi:hypothetical protein